MRVDLLTPHLEAQPGETLSGRLRVHNDGIESASYSVALHGIGQEVAAVPIGGEPVAPGGAIDVDVTLTVPETFGSGAHLVAVEVRSDRRGEPAGLADLMVSVGSLDRVVTTILPSVIRAGRRAGFFVEVSNRRAVDTDIELSGSGPGLSVRIFKPRVRLGPGEVRRIRARVRGPRHVVGDPVHRVLTVTASANSAPSYATASFQQRAVIPRPLRTGMIGIAVVLVWALIAGSAVLWFSRRDQNAGRKATATTTVPGAATPAGGSTPSGGTTPAGGSTPAGGQGGEAGGGTGGQGGGQSGGGSGQAGGAAAGQPSATIVRGIVKAGTIGDDAGVLVTLTPVNSTAPPASTAPPVSGLRRVAGGPGRGVLLVASEGAPAAATTGDDEPVKRWPARYATYSSGTLSNLQTVSVETQNSDRDGSFQFHGVGLRRTYEVSFSKPGYVTQSFIVATKADGAPVEVNAELKPGDGVLAGSIVLAGGGGGVGGAHLSVTDGTLSFETTSSTDRATLGQWSLERLSTPGVYTITVTKDGLGTEVLQVTLGAKGERSGLVVVMSSGVGSISGMVTSAGSALGGVTLTATTGDVTATTTSVTEGAKGTFNFPQMKLGATYTVTASADGYITQTQRVNLSGNVTGVDFAMVSTTGTVHGRVLSHNPAKGADPVPLVNAGISLTASGLEVRASSAAEPDAGAFQVGDLPPGTYLLTVSRYDHAPWSQTITVGAGEPFDAGTIVLEYQAPKQTAQTGSLVIRTFDSFSREIKGATVALIDNGGRLPTVTETMPDSESAIEFTNVPIGTYRVVVSKSTFQPTIIEHLSIGLGPVARQVTLFKYGSARGTVVDALGGYHAIDLLDGSGNPVYQAAGELVYFDPATAKGPETVVPALSCFRPSTPPGASCYAPKLVFHDTTGKLIVKYQDDATGAVIYVRDTNGDNVPEQELAKATEQVGNAQLNGYTLLLYRVDGGTESCIRPLEVPASQAADAQGRIEWKVDPLLQLPPATYALRFTPLAGDTASPCAGAGALPAGYAAIPLTSGLPGDVARFTIPPTLDQQIVVPPITVARYPIVTGRVLVPHVDAGVTTFASFATAQQGGLKVTFTCPGTAPFDAPIADVSGAIGFTLTRQQVAALAGVPVDLRGSLPSCAVDASYTGSDQRFISVHYVLAWHTGFAADLSTDPPTAIPSPEPDIDLRVALVTDPTVVSGTVQWLDYGFDPPIPHPLGGTAVDVPGAVVGYTPGLAADPSAVPKDLHAVADGNGQWALAVDGQRQLIGTAAYGFTSPEAAPGETQVVADGNAWTMTASAHSTVEHGASPGPADVYLEPHPGSFTVGLGVISKRAWDLVKNDLDVTATAPRSPLGCDETLTIATPATAENMHTTITKDPACAGTWSVSVDGKTDASLQRRPPPADPGAPASQSFCVPPGAAASQRFCVPPDAQPSPAPTAVELVDLGEVQLELRDPQNNLLTDADVSAAIAATGANTLWPGPPDTTAKTFASGGTVQFRKIPVDDAAPLQGVAYQLSLDAPNYGVGEATYSISDVTDPANPVVLAAGVHPPPRTDGLDRVDVPFENAAGRRLLVVITVPLPVVIVGAVQGLLTPAGYTPAAYVPLIAGQGLTVTAVNDIGTLRREATASGSGYILKLPTGTYTLTYHAADFVDLVVPNLVLGPGTVTRDVTLSLVPGEVTVTAKTAETGGEPVVGASAQLFWGATTGGLPTGSASYAGPTDSNGFIDLTGVTPGTYTLVVRKLSNGHDLNFPVMGTLTIPRSPSAALSLTVIMPLVDGSIAGTVTAVNSLGHAVALPSSATITRVYDVPGASSNPLGGEAIETDPPARSVAVTEASAGKGGSYEFTRLAYGVHTLTFSHTDGYAEPAADAVTVTGVVKGRDQVYRANDVTVSVAVVYGDGSAVTDATVTLTAPGSTKTDYPMTYTAAAGAYRVAGVPPEIDQYTLTISGANTRHTTSKVTVPPSAGTVTLDQITVSRAADITGTLERRDSETDTAAFAGATVQLYDTSPTPRLVDSAVTGADGSFTLQAVTTGTYTVSATPDGYRPATAAVNVTSVNGRNAVYPVGTLTVVKWASAAYTVPAGVVVAANPVVQRTVSGNTYTFPQLDPDTTYTFTATGASFVPQSDQLDPDIGIGYTRSFTWRTVTVGTTGGTPSTVAVTSNGSAVSITPDTSGGSRVYHLLTTAPYLFTASGAGLVTQSQSLTAGTAAATVTFTWLQLAVALSAVPLPNDTAVGVALPAGLSGSVLVTKNSDSQFTVTGLAPSQTYSVTATGTGLDSQIKSAAIGTVNGTLSFAWGAVSGTATSTQPSSVVSLFACDTAACVTRTLRPPTITIRGSSGDFLFSGLRPGNYVITVVRDDGKSAEFAFAIGDTGTATPSPPYTVPLPTTTTTTTTSTTTTTTTAPTTTSTTTTTTSTSTTTTSTSTTTTVV